MSTPTSPAARGDVRVGPYRLLARIGEGGMGVVHLAQAPDGRRLALKVLRPHIIGDDEARERLAREVASLRRVSSPRIAEVLDADPWGPTPYVATRYVPGLSLHQHVREEGPITGADLRWFAAGLAEAVIAVHSVGVLHRDVKPSNVLLEGRSPVLIDFGLARLADDPRITQAGWLLGTPGYLAPEVLYGEDATTATDVHAWAATLVFAATGRPPFGTGPAMAIMDRVRRGEHDLGGVPADLLPVVREALSAEPDARPSTGAVLAAVRRLGSTALTGAADPAQEEHTVPVVLAGRSGDPDLTDRLPERATPPLTTPPTAPLTVPGPVPGPVPARSHPEGTAPPTIPGQADWRPARQPYMAPRPPTPHAPAQTPAHVPVRAQAPAAAPSPGPAPVRPPLLPTDPHHAHHGHAGPGRAGPLAGLRRALLLGGLLGGSVAGFAVAPYAVVVAAALLVLAVRTLSWTLDAALLRQHHRGRRRWFDGPLTLLSTPWYLLVAVGGTLMLLVWSASLTLLVGLGWAAARLPTEPGLLVLGAVFALALWWGPGARRLRLPIRRAVTRTARDPWPGWAAVVLLALALAPLVWLALTRDVSWAPQAGPPWRPETMLGGLVRWW